MPQKNFRHNPHPMGVVSVLEIDIIPTLLWGLNKKHNFNRDNARGDYIRTPEANCGLDKVQFLEMRATYWTKSTKNWTGNELNKMYLLLSFWLYRFYVSRSSKWVLKRVRKVLNSAIFDTESRKIRKIYKIFLFSTKEEIC